MWITDQWQRWRAWRMRRLLAAHPETAWSLVRQDTDLTMRAVQAYHTQTATQGLAPSGQTLQAFQTVDAQARTPERETFPFPVLTSTGFGARRPLQTTLPKPAPWTLRLWSEKPPARRAINAITNPILDLPWIIQLKKPIGRNLHDTMPEPTSEQQARIEAATAMFARPNNEQTWREVLEMLCEDLLVLGAGPLEVQRNRSDHRPLFLWPVDAQSLRINAAWVPGSQDFRYSQTRGLFYSAMGTTDDVRLRDDELLYMRLNPRANTPFGYGYLEVAFDTVNSFLGAVDFATRRSSNSHPNFLIFLGENVTPEQTRRFQAYWESEIEGMGKIPILGGGRQPTVANMIGNGKDPLWIAWQEWLVRIIAMSFGISPMKLGLERDVNRNTAETQASGDWESIAPVANLIRDHLTHWLLWKRLGWEDLEFTWQIRTADEAKQADILATQYAMNAITVDEIRQVYERPPLPDGMGTLTKTAYEASIMAALEAQKSRQSAVLQERQAEIALQRDEERQEREAERMSDEDVRQQREVPDDDTALAGAGITPFMPDESRLLSPEAQTFLRALHAVAD